MPKPKEQPGRKVTEADPRELKRITVTLGYMHTRYLDKLVDSICDNFGLTRKQAPERSAIIRAFVESMEDAEVNISKYKTEKELKAWFTEKLRRK